MELLKFISKLVTCFIQDSSYIVKLLKFISKLVTRFIQDSSYIVKYKSLIYRTLTIIIIIIIMWNRKVTIIPIVIGAFGTVTKGLLKVLEDLEVGGRVDTTQTTAWLRTARILRRVLETWGDLLSLKLQWRTISWCWLENSKGNYR